ncbi:sugar phosphate nucleotidyltransferase [Longirhabdus pacifica]|uniref:sugar phosphate nucleotidyltransferase n=1 Tax=Longirhabdus pacifica TaxID=2305227 RepID=UPI001008697D|nr:sugar phosphate nucleotidyltransferase [Longirhabdus pacifica]
MKGIVLAGGTGSRLYPLTKVTNKHLLPVGKYPMIYYAIDKLQNAGIRDVLVVTSKEHMGDIVSTLGSGTAFGVDLTYKVQDKPGGIAQALRMGKDFVKDDLVTVILGDNIFPDSIKMYVERFKQQKKGAMLLLKEVEDPHRFGVAEIQGDRIVSIEEKPKKPKSNYAVTGIYLYDHQVFSWVDQLKPSDRGELEITDINNIYIKQRSCAFDLLNNWWTDAGTHASYLLANQLASNLSLSCLNIESC